MQIYDVIREVLDQAGTAQVDGRLLHAYKTSDALYSKMHQALVRVPATRIGAIVKGERAVTADTALRLARFFGTSPEFWMNLQTLYELRLARQETGARVAKLPTRARRASSGRAIASIGR